MTIKVRISAEIYPTEEEEKVVKALNNIIDIEKARKIEKIKENILEKVFIEGPLDILSKLKTKIAIRHIQIHTRQLLLYNRNNNSSYLFLNKQAAFSNNVSLCESRNESPLGPIMIELSGETDKDLDAAIVWLTEGIEYNSLAEM